MDPVDEGCWHMKMEEFLDHQMQLEGVECRTEVDEESGEVAGGFHVLQGEEEACHSILLPFLAL